MGKMAVIWDIHMKPAKGTDCRLWQENHLPSIPMFQPFKSLQCSAFWKFLTIKTISGKCVEK
jgi:hypothetical protein